jgi:anthranilate 1,2-dioxygenase small subunit
MMDSMHTKVIDGTHADHRLMQILLHHEVEIFNSRYALSLDDQRLSDWIEMFTDDAFYIVTSRENHDRDLPVGLIYCENKGMIQDRAFALKETSMYAPRYLRHFISNLIVSDETEDGTVKATSNYLLLQVLFDRPDATVHQIGVYYDIFWRVDGALKLARRCCVYDSLLVPNALCLPV